MLDEDRRLADCVGKTAHETKAGALKQVRHVKKGGPVVAYRCAHCRRWHIGRVMKRMWKNR